MTAGLSNEANALLERAKRQGGPSAAQTAKIGAAVFAATTTTAAAATSTTAATTVTVATTGSTGSSLITLVGAGLVATALGIGGTVAVKRSLAPPAQQPPPRARVAVAPANAPQAPKPIVAVALPSEPPPAEPAHDAPPTTEPKQPPVAATRVTRAVAEPADPTPTPRTAEPRSAEPTVAPTPDLPEAEPPRSTHHEFAQPDSTAAQVAALTAAVDALERHEPELARVTAREARLADPRGVLSPELMVVEITALCELGRRDDALTLSRQMSSAEQTPLVRGKLGRTCVGTGQ